MAGDGQTHPDKTVSHKLPNPELTADANQKDCPPHCPLTRQTNERTDPQLDAPLTQDHRRGTLGRERRVCEQQKE